VSNDKGMKLVVDGKDFMVNGMNWDYYPIGTILIIVCGNPDDVIKAALDNEMDYSKTWG
jgi:hypothetical protein